MGRSTASCFKIIACGSDSVDTDEFDASESKGRGWSFGKRSARHQVLSNTVISETTSASKDTIESTVVYSNVLDKDHTSTAEPKSSDVSEKNSAFDCVDESKIPTSGDTESLKISATKVDVTPKEADVVVIQTAIRLFLAQRVLSKHKNVIKLQAAVRGHLVRRHAVGTLPVESQDNDEKMFERFDNLRDIKCGTDTSEVPSESEDNLITYDADRLDFQDLGKATLSDKSDNIPVPSVETDTEPVETETENEQQMCSRKTSNPAFIAAQSKFEELSSADNKVKVTRLSSQDNNEPCNFTTKQKEIIVPAQNSALHGAAQVAISECGTELSITSTLDSPDRSDDVVVHEFELEVKEKTFEDVDLTPSDSIQPEKPEMGSEVYNSPEPSESQTKPRPTIRTEKSGSNPKLGVSLAVKKRQSLSGPAKSDSVDEEPRESNSSNSLPSYMQATKSARAKAILNGSPRSSPDSQIKDVYIKKRQSLSGSNGKQGSPKISSSLSHAQHDAKANGAHSPHERKWQR